MSDCDGVAPGQQQRIAALFPRSTEVVYLNTAAAGLSWQGQGAAAARFFDEHKSLGYAGRHEWRAVLQRTRQSLAALLRVTADQMSFAGSTTEALNLLAHAVPLKPDDQVLLAQDEFPSLRLAWSSTALRGAELVAVSIEDEAARTEELIDRITPSTRVICVSHVHWSTGTRVDLKRLRHAADRVGARLIVDGAHAVGAMEVDASIADFYTGPVFKWLLSAFGLAYMMASERLAAELEPAFRGYRNEAPSRNLQSAHANYPAVYALQATLEQMQQLGWPWIYSRVQSLTGLLHEELTRTGWNVVTPREQRAGIVSIAHQDAAERVENLSAQGVEISERDGRLRISPHFYNTEEDIRRFLRCLK